uniref:Inner membrane protein n=1 Tax=uncultured organism TaxID=155900 RepID=M1PWB2_9ZZZZ|nr:inner membrane protein [uncultured organism]
MALENKKYQNLLTILRDGLAPALGCTEPIAIAYSTASAAQKVDGKLEKIKIRVNRNIYKNGLRVGIPGTGKTGLYIAAALGYLIGDPAKELEVIEGVNNQDIKRAEDLLNENKIEIDIVEGLERLFIESIIITDKNKARAITIDKHLNITEIETGQEFNEFEIHKKEKKESEYDIKEYTLKDIFEFADQVKLSELAIIEKGINLSYEIVEKGKERGVALGDSLQKMIDSGLVNDNMMNRAQLLAATASEARMSGCKKAVMSNSGSGNQGITAFLTILGAAEVKDISEDKLYRSLVVSNLVTMYIKSYLGVLSAMCGAAVAAGTGSSIGITYMLGGDLEDALHTTRNMLGTITGIICDGAKDGCAYKVALSSRWAVQSALLAFDNTFIPSKDGILADSFEKIIENLGRVNAGMTNTDETIMEIMLENE